MAGMVFCRGCGKEMHETASSCPHCGAQQVAQSDKSRISAALFAFFLGGFGAHKFYLGQTGKGVLYLLFFWTLIPSILAFISFVRFLCMSDGEFAQRYK